MRFEIVGKTKAKLCNVKIQSHKMGQKNTVPAVALRFMATMSNNVLGQFDKLLKNFLYEKNGSAGAKQQVLDGVDVVSDTPQLRQAGAKLGELHWKDEQTGSKLVIYIGATGHANIVLKDGKVHAFKLVPKEGGTTQVFFTAFFWDLDAETLGDLGVLHQHDVEIELEAPEVVQDTPLLPEEPEAPAGATSKVTRLPKPGAAKEPVKSPLPVLKDGSANPDAGGDPDTEHDDDNDGAGGDVLTPAKALALHHKAT